MKKQIGLTILSWVTLLLFMGATRPNDLPVLALIVPFILLFLSVLSSWHLIERLFRTYLVKSNHKPRLRHFGAVLSASFIVVVVLQSLRQLTVKDVITLFAILAIGYLYVARNRYDATRS